MWILRLVIWLLGLFDKLNINVEPGGHGNYMAFQEFKRFMLDWTQENSMSVEQMRNHVEYSFSENPVYLLSDMPPYLMVKQVDDNGSMFYMQGGRGITNTYVSGLFYDPRKDGEFGFRQKAFDYLCGVTEWEYEGERLKSREIEVGDILYSLHLDPLDCTESVVVRIDEGFPVIARNKKVVAVLDQSDINVDYYQSVGMAVHVVGGRLRQDILDSEGEKLQNLREQRRHLRNFYAVYTRDKKSLIGTSYFPCERLDTN